MKTQTSSEGPLTNTQQQLVLDHLRLVESTARAITSSEQRREELRSCGHEGLVHAARIFEAALGVPFAAFAAMQIRWAMLKGLRTERRQLRANRSEKIVEIMEEREQRHPGVIDPRFEINEPDAEDRLLEAEQEVETRAVVARAVAQLCPEDREIVESHYFRGNELKALVRPGASYATIRRRHNGALVKLEKRLSRGPIAVGAIMS